MKNTKKRGFTIVELVVVIAVIAILASVLIPTFSDIVTKAKKTAALQDARNAWVEYVAKVVSGEETDDNVAEGKINTIIVTLNGNDTKTYTFYTNGYSLAGETKPTGTELTDGGTYTLTKGVFTKGGNSSGEGGGS